MNFATPVGLLLGGMVVVFTVTGELPNPGILMSKHAALMVLGGTLAATLICFPLNRFFNMFTLFFRAVLGRNRHLTLATINEIVSLSEKVNEGQSIEAEIPRIQNEFLRESMELFQGGGLSDEELDEVLHKRVEMQNERYKRDGMTFKIIGKFPPAFGLIGASMGMIALLQGLGQPEAFKTLGPAMSIALVATFYGLVLANFILIPLGENMSHASEEDLVIRRIVVEGVRLIKEEKHPLLVAEYLKSYIPPKERNRMKNGVG